MNAIQIAAICGAFGLGTPIGQPTPVLGGLLHTMWRIDTINGSYAVKQLTTDINLTQQVRYNYELSEQIAHSFKDAGINAIGALKCRGKYLFTYDNNIFLVYPWVNVAIVIHNTINVTHAIKIAHLLARMHTLNLQISDLPDSQINTYTEQKILSLIAQAKALSLSFAKYLHQHQECILKINNLCQKSIPVLQTVQRISHADLDQKNVLWDANENPILIDWESARKINPSQELISVALDWSSITTNAFDAKIFKQIIAEYTNAGGVIEANMMQAAFCGVQLNWINWMLFNVQRSIKNEPNNSNLTSSSTDQVICALETILRIESLTSKLNNS